MKHVLFVLLVIASGMPAACDKMPTSPSSPEITSSLPLNGFGGVIPVSAGQIAIYIEAPVSNAGAGTETITMNVSPDDPAAFGMAFATSTDAQACRAGDCSRAIAAGRALTFHQSGPGYVLALVNRSTVDVSFGYQYSYTPDN